MNGQEQTEQDDSLTLDPPGSIAVIGAGPIGIEAALYGRYLGYDVTIFEAVAVGSSMLDRRDSPLPMLPDRCLSPIAISALNAQQPSASSIVAEPLIGSTIHPLPMTHGQWIDNGLVPLTQTDLLRNRIRMPARIIKIIHLPVQADEEDEETSDIPADFRLTFVDDSGTRTTHDSEVVILAIGNSDPIECDFPVPGNYIFQIRGDVEGDPEQEHRLRLKQIVAIYAGLAGRKDLDLYRPQRG